MLDMGGMAMEGGLQEDCGRGEREIPKDFSRKPM